MNKPDSVGIVGFGRFGRLLAHTICSDFRTMVYDPHAETVEDGGLTVLHSLQELCAQSKVIFLCVPIMGFQACIEELKQYIQPGTVVLDVCSVKMYPEQIMQKYLPDTIHIIPTHPMFGPDSANNGWVGLPFVFCPPVREAKADTSQMERAFWMEYFGETKGASIVVMSAEEHDRITAYNLCLTQLLGRVLGNMKIQSSAIDAKSFQHLLQMKEISYNDSMELLIGLHRFNPFAAEMRQTLRDELLRVEEQVTQPPVKPFYG